MNLPNKLTILRIILVFFLSATLLISFPYHYAVSLLLFIIASITDLLDGKIARKHNLVTDFGKFCDPLADKILVVSVLLIFVELGLCSCIPVILVLFREFAVTSIRLVAASKGKVVSANIWGKIKTVTQMVSIILVLVFQIIIEIIKLYQYALPIQFYTLIMMDNYFLIIGNVAIWISTVFCIISGITYIVSNKKFIQDM